MAKKSCFQSSSVAAMFTHGILKSDANNLKEIINSVCSADAHLMTDTGVLRNKPTGHKHSLVNHRADEYVRYDEGVCVTTNTVEATSRSSNAVLMASTIT